MEIVDDESVIGYVVEYADDRSVASSEGIGDEVSRL